ncbi:MAG: hypothetical protein WCI36_03335 [bacterium]
MDKTIKIGLIAVVVLGLVSGAFLFFGRKKAPAPLPAKKVQATAPINSSSLTPAEQKPTTLPSQAANAGTPTPSTTAPVAKPAVSKAPVAASKDDARKKIVTSQWAQCAGKTMPATTNLIWSIKILEGIPVGGTYAKGTLNGDAGFPVQITIKKTSTIVDKIKAMLVTDKMAFLRGTCGGFSASGAVMLEVF